MIGIRILNREDISKAIKIHHAIDVVEFVYKSKSEGNTEVWPTIFYEFHRGKADMDIKSGYLKEEGIFGHKTITWFGDNIEKGLPTLIGMIAVFDAKTGAPMGLTDASYITGIRTGAAGALGAKYLARKSSENLLIVGAGNQSLFQIAAMLTVMPNIKRVRVAALNLFKTKKFVGDVRHRLQREFEIDANDIVFEVVEDLETAAKESDIIITITPSRRPIIQEDWVQKGTHISCIGADMEGKQEIDSKIMPSAIIFTDDMIHCKEFGEIEIPLKQGIIAEDNIMGEIGDLILNKAKGRTSEEEITIFDATGMALLDIATAKIALQLAEELGIGTEVEI